MTNDAVTAHLGALGGEPGAVIVAGTGAIALAVGRRRRWARADGWGTLLGDDGGGYWIGRAGLALRAARRTTAARGSPDAAAARRRGAVRRARRLDRAACYDARATRVGGDRRVQRRSTSRDAARLAATRRPPPRSSRPARAAAQLARAPAVAARARAGRPGAGRVAVVSWSGGLFAAGELMLEPLRGPRCPRGVALRAPLGDALDGAARLLERPTAVRDLIHETEPHDATWPPVHRRRRAPERAEIDRLPTAELVRLMNEDDAVVRAAVAAAQRAIAAAVDAIVAAARGGRAADLRRRGDGGAARRARRQRVRADVQHRPGRRRDRGRARSR